MLDIHHVHFFRHSLYLPKFSGFSSKVWDLPDWTWTTEWILERSDQPFSSGCMEHALISLLDATCTLAELMQGFDMHEGEEWWQSKREICSLCFPFMSFRLDLVILQSNFQLSLWFLLWTAKRPHLSLSWQNTDGTYFPYNHHVSLWTLIDKSTTFHLSAAPFNLRRSFPALQQPRQHIFSVASENFNLSCGRLFTGENAKEQCFEKQHAEPGFPWFSTEVCSDSLGMTETRWVNLFPCQHYGWIFELHLSFRVIFSTCFLHPKCRFVPILLLIDSMQECDHISLGTLWDMPAKAMICSAMRAWPKSASMVTWKREGTRFEEKRHKHK